MKKQITILSFAIIAFFAFFSCKNEKSTHFINDTKIREEVRKDFLERKEIGRASCRERV